MSTSQNLHAGLNLGATDPDAHLDAEPQIFGFWIFMMTDLIIFALLFATYTAMSQNGVADGPSPAELYTLGKPFWETMFLLFSSFTFGFASLALKYDAAPKAVMGWLFLTFLLGLGFLGLEAYDFIELVKAGAGPQTSGFLSSYFLLLGTHFVHVAGGVIWGVILLVQLSLFGLKPVVKTRVMRLALFWHMLDIVWIGIFTVVYLLGVI